MEGLAYALIGIIAFWILINKLHDVYKEKFEKLHIEVNGVFLMWKFKLLPNKLFNFIRKHYRAFRMLFNIGIVLSTIVFLYAMKIYLDNLSGIFGKLISGSRISEGVGTPIVPIIPGVTIAFSELPYLLLALAIAVTFHESFHAIAAISENIKVESWGLALILFLPAAFIEPSEREFKKAKLASRVRVYSAGPSANVILALLTLAFIAFSIPALYNVTGGLEVVKVVEGSPAYRGGVEEGSLIVMVNGVPLSKDVSLVQMIFMPTILYKGLFDVTRQYEGLEANITLTLMRSVNGKIEMYNVTVHKLANESKLGVYIIPRIILQGKTAIAEYVKIPLLKSAIWMFIVNIGFALINVTPLIITDGGKMFEELITRLFGEKGKKASLTIQSILIIILIINILASMM